MAGSVRLSSRDLVGRDEELAAALRALPDASGDGPGVVLVSGPAGIGKTRLANALAEQLRGSGVRVLVGSCVYPGSAPLAALIAGFRNADPPAVQILDALTGAVEMRRPRLFELLRSTLVGLARRAPTVLLVEDVHWSDRATRDALLYLCAAPSEGRWGLVVTYRDDQVAGTPQLRDFVDVPGRQAVARVTLGPLSASAVAAQVAGITGVRPADNTARRIHRRSGGIPLLVEEVLAADAAGIRGVPDHLRDLFLARVRALGPSGGAIRVLAVAAEPCDERLVAAVLDVEATAAAKDLDRALAAQLLTVERDGYRLRHELLREAVHEAIPPALRRQLHGQVARILDTRRHPDVTALAHHWYHACEAERAFKANLRAAELAERLHAPPAAHEHLERAVDCWAAAGATADLAALLLRTAAAAELEGRFERAAELTERALGGANDPASRALCLARLMLYRWRGGDGHGAAAAFASALDALPGEAAPRVRARVLSSCAWFRYVSYHPGQARELAEAAFAAAEESGEDLGRCWALLPWGVTRTDPDNGLAALRRARDLAVALDASEELARAHLAIGLTLRRLGRNAERVDAIRRGLSELAVHGLDRSFEAALTYQLIDVLLEVGSWDEVERLIANVRTRDIHGVPALFVSGHEAQLATLCGQDLRAAAAAERTMALGRDIPQQHAPLVTALLAQADGALWARRTDAAADLLGRAAELLREDPLLTAHLVSLRARLAADRAELARRRCAPISFEAGDDLPVPDADPSPVVRAHVATAWAEHARPRRDPQPWREALAAWQAVQNPYRAAYCQWRLAHAMLRLRSGRPEALVLLDAASQTCDTLGAVPLGSAIEALAAAARLRLRGTQPADAAARIGLTARELEVLPLIAAGRTNAEIAEAFVISPRTVGVHVSRILQKLGAARRTEAADIARRSGLLVD